MNFWLVSPLTTPTIGNLTFSTSRDELFNNIQNAPLKIPNYLSNDAKSLLKAVTLFCYSFSYFNETQPKGLDLAKETLRKSKRISTSLISTGKMSIIGK